MNIASATMIIEFALVGYIEDCITKEGKEAQEIQEAWTLILKNLDAPHYTEKNND